MVASKKSQTRASISGTGTDPEPDPLILSNRIEELYSSTGTALAAYGGIGDVIVWLCFRKGAGAVPAAVLGVILYPGK